MASKKKSRAQKEEAQLEQSYRKVAGKSGKRRKKGRTVPIVIICLVLGLMLAGAAGVYLFFVSDVTPGIILNNVSALGVELGGMTKEEASEALQAAQERFDTTAMTVTILDENVTISPQTADITLDVQAAAQAAYDVGRTGSTAHRKAQQLLAATVGVKADVSQCLTMDTAAIRAALEALESKYNTQLIQTTAELTGEVPELTTDQEPASPQVLTVTLGTPGCELDIAALCDQVLEAYAAGSFEVTASCKCTQPDSVDLDALYSKYCIAPVSATMDETTFQATVHSYGYGFDMQQAEQLLSSAESGEKVKLVFSKLAPEQTQQSLQDALFRDVLGTYTATASSEPKTRDVNLRLSCEAISGIVLLPGEVLSYNDTLGERTKEAGYKPAASYLGGETVLTYGGGICQTSSCLYMSAMLADMEIVERTNHGYISSYMPYGMDATVSWGGPDFRFSNSSAYPIRIEASASGGSVTVSILGTATEDYYVKMDYEVLSTNPYKTVYREMTADNEGGYKDGAQITSGYTGYKIRTYRCKYSKDTDALLSKEEETTSVYKRRDRVLCKLVTESAPEPTETTAPPQTETQPPETTQPEETTLPGVGGTVTEDG